MKTLFLIILFSIFFANLNAQVDVNQKSGRLDMNRNSVYLAQDLFLTLSANYERLFPLSEKVNLCLRGGLGRDGGNKDNTAIVGSTLTFGKTKHFIEFGLAYQHPNLFEKEGDDNPKFAIMGGYRYEAPKGFMLKVYPEFLPDFWPDEDSWGSFPFLGFALGYSF